MYAYALQDHQFGPHTIRTAEVFASTKLSFAFVNLKPVVPGMRPLRLAIVPAMIWPLCHVHGSLVISCSTACMARMSCLKSCMGGPLRSCCLALGHVLVCSRRVVQRFTRLQPEEVADMWYVANSYYLDSHSASSGLPLRPWRASVATCLPCCRHCV